jgi:hypothetical protein
MLAMHNECQIAFANLVMTRIVSSLGESRSRARMMATPANRRADRTDAATVQCADDTEATCTSALARR